MLSLLKVEEESSQPMNLRQNLAATMVQHAWRIFWIKKRLRLNSDLAIQPSSNWKRFRFSTHKSNNGTYFNPLVVLFVCKLHFLIAKRKFKFSMYLVDSNTFYETYTQNTLSYNGVIKDIQTQMNRLEEITNSTNRLVEAIHAIKTIKPQPTESAGQKKKVIEEKDNQPKRTKRCVACWRCLQRRRRKLGTTTRANLN